MSHMKIRIGTSGWHYSHWQDNFYPAELSRKKYLAFYSDRFNTAEINNTFYRLPAKATLEAWRDETPDDFIFAVKASRYLTHMKKLKDAKEPLAALLDRTAVLESKLGPVLFQLPPKWHCNIARLQAFIDMLPDKYRYTFEFRDHSWFCDSVYKALRQKNMALCFYHLEGFMSPRESTADFVYVRLHGPGNAYRGSYDTSALSGWAGAFSSWQKQGKKIYCYFDNDEKGFAAANALELAGMLTNE